MSRDLDLLRRIAADGARDAFDFGGDLVHSDEWVEDRADQLTCRVEIRMPGQLRSLSFRVCFPTGSDRPHHTAVAEKLAPL